MKSAHLSFEQFAARHSLTLQWVRSLARRGSWSVIKHNGKRYQLQQHGTCSNGAPRYYIVVQDDGKKKKHLTPDQRKAALQMLYNLVGSNSANAVAEVANRFGVSYWSVYRLWRENKTERQKRSDAGTQRVGVPPGAREWFKRFYLDNAQRNARLAYEKTVQHFGGLYFPYRYALEWRKEIQIAHRFEHYEGDAENRYSPTLRHDNWAEWEFMQLVTVDMVTIPDRCIHNGEERTIVAGHVRDMKTGWILAKHVVARSFTHEDVMILLLDFVYNWGKPDGVRFDNDPVFKNEVVQRFVSGWWTSEEHELKERIDFGPSHAPKYKPGHERFHRIIKDEFCCFSPSYSPNRQESRKPTKRLAYVAPTQTLDEWIEKYEHFLHTDYVTRQRTMWMSPHHTRRHQVNQDRPRTMTEAFERAYATFTPRKLEPFRLAYLYARHWVKQLKQNVFALSYADENFMYIPKTLMVHREGDHFKLLMDPTNVGHVWVCELNGETVICEAWDPRYEQSGMPREQAKEVRKYANRVRKAAKEQAKALKQLQSVSPTIANNVRKRVGLKEEVPTRNIEQAVFSSVRAPETADERIDDEQLSAGIEYMESLVNPTSPTNPTNQPTQREGQ